MTAPKTTPDKANSPMDVEPSVLWAMYTQAPVPHQLVDLPVADDFVLRSALPKMAMVPLTAEEAMLCEVEADVYARGLMAANPPKEGERSAAYDKIVAKEQMIRVLYRACRDAGDPTLQRKVFQAPSAMRQKFTLDQLSVMTMSYLRVERLLSPIRFLMTEEQMNGFLGLLKEGGSRAPLDLLSSELLRDLVWHLVFRPTGSGSPSGSPGSPPGTPTLPSETPPPTAEAEAAPVFADASIPVSDAPPDPKTIPLP